MKFQIDEDAIFFMKKSIKKAKLFIYYIPFAVILIMIFGFLQFDLSLLAFAGFLFPIGLFYLATYNATILPFTLLKTVVKNVVVEEDKAILYCELFPEGIIYPSDEITEIPYLRSKIHDFDKYDKIIILKYKEKEIYWIFDFFHEQNTMEVLFSNALNKKNDRS